MTDDIVDRLRDYAMLDGERLEPLWHEIDQLRARAEVAEREEAEWQDRYVREIGEYMDRLAEQTETLSRLLTEVVVDAPCPTPAQWRQLQEFCKGYLAALRREDAP